MELIDKSALVAEIKRRKKIVSDPILSGSDLMIGERNAYFGLLSFINTLEVKEVDLEKELSLEDYKSFFEKHPDLSDDWGFDEAWMFAKHFFELGLKAQEL